MPKIKLKINLIDLDIDRYVRDYHAGITLAVRQAASDFLTAAIPATPVYTGFARGAFANLIELVGDEGTFASSGLRSSFARTTKAGQRKMMYKGVRRTFDNGRPFGSTPEEILGVGRLTAASTKGRIVFFLSINIDYYNEEKWQAFKAGEIALLANIKEYLKVNKPDVGKYKIEKTYGN